MQPSAVSNPFCKGRLHVFVVSTSVFGILNFHSCKCMHNDDISLLCKCLSRIGCPAAPKARYRAAEGTPGEGARLDAPVGPARGEGERRGEHLRVRAREILRGLRVWPRDHQCYLWNAHTKNETTQQLQTMFSIVKTVLSWSGFSLSNFIGELSNFGGQKLNLPSKIGGTVFTSSASVKNANIIDDEFLTLAIPFYYNFNIILLF